MSTQPGLDLRGVEIFLAICDTGGLTSAARSLGLTQAAVSQHLAKLEREIGLTLLDRSVRPPLLTSAGRFLRQRGRVLMRDISALRRELDSYRISEIPKLRLGIMESAAGAMLSLLVRRLAGKIGSLAVTSGTTHPLLPELLHGSLDMLISSEQIDDDERLVSESLLVEPLVLVLPKSMDAPRDWQDMRKLARTHDFIGYGVRRRIGRIIAHALDRNGVTVHGSREFDSSLALFDSILSGAGWAATTPLCLLSAGLGPQDVIIANFPGPPPIRSVSAIWMKEREDVELAEIASICREVIAERVVPKLRECAGDAGEFVQAMEVRPRPLVSAGA